VIAGKGHESYQIIGDQRIALDDHQIAEEWLYTRD
jgi:UDP-N-acetylmuramyl tripeptide synthase